MTARALSGREFTYELPDGAGKGAVVSVPFGARGRGAWSSRSWTRRRSACGRSRSSACCTSCRATLVDLALWVADYYGSTPARALELVAPVRRQRRKEQSASGRAAVAGRGGSSGRAERRRRRPPSPGSARAAALSALRADRQRQDRGLPPVRGAGTGARARDDRARSGDRAHAADRRALPGPVRRLGRAAPLRADRRRAAGRARADLARRGPRRGRRPLGGLRADAGRRPDLRRRGARSRRTSRSPTRATTHAPSPPSARRWRARQSSTAARPRGRRAGLRSSGSSCGERIGAKLPGVKIVDLRREAGYPLSAPLLAELGGDRRARRQGDPAPQPPRDRAGPPLPRLRDDLPLPGLRRLARPPPRRDDALPPLRPLRARTAGVSRLPLRRAGARSGQGRRSWSASWRRVCPSSS